MLNVDFNTGGQNPQVIRNATGSVVEISAGYQNAVNDVQRKSVDFSLDGNIYTSDEYGSFDFRGEATKYLEF